jgi:glycosyltransferase involved in cell wall biosynthesis
MTVKWPPVDESRCCIYVPCYNAARLVAATIGRIPWDKLPPRLCYALLMIDNASTDGTQAALEEIRARLTSTGREAHVILHSRNRGYGGSVKSALDFCREQGFGYLVVLHADGQYAPEVLPELLAELLDREDEALHFGSRLAGRPLEGGMPLYKYLANRALTWLQNRVLGLNLSEYHSGYRLYRMALLKGIPYHRNRDSFVFDNEILFQLAHFGRGIGETPIPTHYGDEKSHVPVVGTPLGILGCVASYLLVRAGWRRDARYMAE